MDFVIQNKLGFITITVDAIKRHITNFFVKKHIKLLNLNINTNHDNKYIFDVTIANKKTNIINTIDNLINALGESIKTNLQIFGSIIVIKVGK